MGMFIRSQLYFSSGSDLKLLKRGTSEEKAVHLYRKTRLLIEDGRGRISLGSGQERSSEISEIPE